jgi:glycosyltransferase involved in cell wall biosynthesis
MMERWGIPTAINVDGIEWERAKWNRLGRGVFKVGARLTARSKSHLVADSRAIAGVWKRRFGVDPTFIPYGADIVSSGRRDRIEPLGLHPERYSLVVARLIPENNVELTLKAAEGVAFPNYPLVVVGSANYDAPVEKELLARQHNGTVRWLGHVSDQELLTQLWSNAGMYVHGHSVGGTNPALLQALAAGAPTIALDTPYNREVVEDPAHLYAKSVDSLRRAMRRLMYDDDHRDHLRKNGRAVVLERYQWEDVCARYEALLVRLARAGIARLRAR